MKVGEGRIKTQPGGYMIAGEGLAVGRDVGDPVTQDYPGERPYRFTGGTIKRVAVDVSGEPYIDLEREAAGHADARMSARRRQSGTAMATTGANGQSVNVPAPTGVLISVAGSAISSR